MAMSPAESNIAKCTAAAARAWPIAARRWRLASMDCSRWSAAAGHQADRSRARGGDALHEAPRKVWIRIFPHKSFTKKPLETRMGKGKGPLEGWVAVIPVRPTCCLRWTGLQRWGGRREALRLAAHQTAHQDQVHFKRGDRSAFAS